MSRRLAFLADLPVTAVRGIGPSSASALAELGVQSVLDLLMYYPRRYADRTATSTIAELVEGSQTTVHATVERCTLRRLRGGRSMVEVVLADGSGQRLLVTLFNQPWRARQIATGYEVVVHGKPARFRGTLQMASPLLDVVGTARAPGSDGRGPGRHTGRIVAVYAQSERAAISSEQIGEHVAAALPLALAEGGLTDPLSKKRLAELGLVGREEAFREIHEPSSLKAKEQARRRLAFDELWRLQVALAMRKRADRAASRAIEHPASSRLVDAFLAALPFPLTRAQRRAIDEIARDLASSCPMHRLIQGDVGSGKTVVALATLLWAVEGGRQAAFMVPTEVLAEQHFLAAREMLGSLEVDDDARLSGTRPLGVEVLTSRTPSSERARITRGLAEGTVDVVVGTHALLTDDVRFAALGVVVVDEQHRFGVEQRARLRAKGAAGHDPDLLVMTATPIPRTAAMTVYGDLDSTVLDELPPGRSPVRTRWIAGQAGEAAVWRHVRDEVAAGNQAYVVCPLVRPGDEAEQACLEGSTTTPRPPRAAVDEHARLAATELAGLRVGLLHGQLRPTEKQQVMSAFRRAELDVLVATTVVEVGVDVAGATVVVIEDADRFGIAQLHQLRGRVGRGTAPSTCYLLAEPAEASPAETRLRSLESTTDGFLLAEIDLDLRGEGTVLGARQNGRNDLRLASLRRDEALIEPARRLAEAVLDGDPGLERHPAFADEIRLFVGEEEAEYLFKS